MTVDSVVAVSVTSCYFPGRVVVSPTPNPQPGIPGAALVCPLPCNLSGLVGPARSLSPSQYK